LEGGAPLLKEWVAISDGLRESTPSWLDVLRDVKARSLGVRPRLAVGDGALGFWAALEQIDPETVHQRCRFHKMGNVLAALPTSLRGKAKADLQAIWMAETREAAIRAFNRCVARYRAKYPKATEKLVQDRDALLAFYDIPSEPRVHRRTTNPIESTFATVRLQREPLGETACRPTDTLHSICSKESLHGLEVLVSVLMGTTLTRGEAQQRRTLDGPGRRPVRRARSRLPPTRLISS
jgi:hypothetical protein